MSNKTLYLLEMGMDDNNITTDIKNHRVRVLENIDILYCGEQFNMFFEFLQATHRNYRTTNKRTGEPLKRAVEEIIVKDGLAIDTSYTRLETGDGYTWESSFRNSKLEREFWAEHRTFSRKNILEVVNRYKVGEPFTKVCLVEEETKKIINMIGGFREKDIIKKRNFQAEGDFYFHIDQWDSSHKVVEVIRREWEETRTGRGLKDTASCKVDLVTKRIVG